MKLTVTNGEKTTDLTELLVRATVSGDISQGSREMIFTYAASPVDKSIPEVDCALGDAVLLTEGEDVLFSGYVFTREKSTAISQIEVTCFDNGIYLRKNKDSFKFKKQSPASIVREICAKYGIETGEIAGADCKISRNFFGTSLYDILQTVYTLASEQTGEKYYILFQKGKLNILKMKAEPVLKITAGYNLLSARMSESVEKMINRVSIQDSEGKETDSRSDEEAIAQFGRMQEVILKQKDKDARKEADKILRDSGLLQKITVENLGDAKCITGSAVSVLEPYTGVTGLFYIESDTHTYQRGTYKNRLTLRFDQFMDEKNEGEEE